MNRDKRNAKAHCVWLTGLSAAGKTTIAVELEKVLLNEGYRVFILDGDIIREGLCSDLGFSETDREENIRRVGHVARILFDAGNIVICAFISPNREMRNFVRSLFPHKCFSEVYLNCSIEECKKRDPKGLYKKADTGEIKNFTGVSAPYEQPENPEIEIETDILSIEISVESIKKQLHELFTEK